MPLTQHPYSSPVLCVITLEQQLWIKTSNRAGSDAKWWVRDKHKTNRCAFALRFNDGTFAPWAPAWACQADAHRGGQGDVHGEGRGMNTNLLKSPVSVRLGKISVDFREVCGGELSPWHLWLDSLPSSRSTWKGFFLRRRHQNCGNATEYGKHWFIYKWRGSRPNAADLCDCVGGTLLCSTCVHTV